MAYKVIIMSDLYKIIKEIYKFCDDDSILVIDERGEIRRIYCHFVLLAELLPLLREALFAAIADAEKKFNIEMPKYR